MSIETIERSDARRPSALMAVERCLKSLWDSRGNPHPYKGHDRMLKQIGALANAAGMTAKITNGKVKCQWRES